MCDDVYVLHCQLWPPNSYPDKQFKYRIEGKSGNNFPIYMYSLLKEGFI